MSPYEAFYTYVFEKEEVSGPRKSCLYHLKNTAVKYMYLLSLKMMHNTGINVGNLMLKLILAFWLAMSQLIFIEYGYSSRRNLSLSEILSLMRILYGIES